MAPWTYHLLGQTFLEPRFSPSLSLLTIDGFLERTLPELILLNLAYPECTEGNGEGQHSGIQFGEDVLRSSRQLLLILKEKRPYR